MMQVADIETEKTSVGLMVDMNWDRLLYVATIIVALGIGSYIGSLLALAPLTQP